MAVNGILENSRIQLIYQTGEESDGTPILKTSTYNRIKPEANDNELYQFGTVIASLQKFSLYGINRVNEIKLEEV